MSPVSQSPTDATRRPTTHPPTPSPNGAATSSSRGDDDDAATIITVAATSGAGIVLLMCVLVFYVIASRRAPDKWARRPEAAYGADADDFVVYRNPTHPYDGKPTPFSSPKKTQRRPTSSRVRRRSHQHDGDDRRRDALAREFADSAVGTPSKSKDRRRARGAPDRRYSSALPTIAAMSRDALAWGEPSALQETFEVENPNANRMILGSSSSHEQRRARTTPEELDRRYEEFNVYFSSPERRAKRRAATEHKPLVPPSRATYPGPEFGTRELLPTSFYDDVGSPKPPSDRRTVTFLEPPPGL